MTPQRDGPARILLVDDEAAALETEALILRMHGFPAVETCTDGRSALARVAEWTVDLVLLDVTMPGLSGIDVLRELRLLHPAVSVVMATGHDDAATAVACMQLGAYDYVVKPLDQTRLVTTVRKALEHRRLEGEAERLGQGLLDPELSHPETFAEIVTEDRRMHAVFRYIEAIAPTDLQVLVTGETGAGKEFVARALHVASGRRGEFVSVNSAGIDDPLFSDTLFGHAAGAFTGADRERRGLIARAAHGTLFLDEIGHMKPESQVKLLRLLQEGTYYRLGSESEEKTTARIVAATNRDVNDLQSDPAFRKDLFYRLKSHRIHVPALRERPADVPLLVRAFLSRAAKRQGKPTPTAPTELFTILANYSFPGNVRELEGMVADAVSRHTGGVLSCAPFKDAVGLHGASTPVAEAAPAPGVSFGGPLPTADEVELALVKEALQRTGGNKKLAAEMIGMARQTFRSKVALLEARGELPAPRGGV